MFGDGWHNLSGYRVYISAGQVIRGMLGKGRDQRPAWLYRYNSRLGIWSSCVSMSVNAFRSGVRRGTVKINQGDGFCNYGERKEKQNG